MTQRWVCLLGQPVAQSHSPIMHNAGFAAVGLDARYYAHEVSPADLADAVQALRAPDCLGANVTAPHKQAVLPFMDELSEHARLFGAVNTIVNQAGRLTGDNTDARGLARWLREAGIDATGQAVALLGAGGVAGAVIWALADLGARSVLVLNRTPQRAETLVSRLRSHVPVELASAPLETAGYPRQDPFAIVVNATSMGHHGGAPKIDPGWYSPESVAIELAYNPPETGFMRSARAAGARAENGLGMLLHQAVLAFECWTGQTPPVAVYERALMGAAAI